VASFLLLVVALSVPFWLLGALTGLELVLLTVQRLRGEPVSRD